MGLASAGHGRPVALAVGSAPHWGEEGKPEEPRRASALLASRAPRRRRDGCFVLLCRLGAEPQVSLALVIAESVRPQMSVLWRLPNTPIWRNIKQESTGHFVPGVMVVRVGSSMYFANVAYIRDYIHKMVGQVRTCVRAPRAETHVTRGLAPLAPRTGANLCPQCDPPLPRAAVLRSC